MDVENFKAEVPTVEDDTASDVGLGMPLQMTLKRYQGDGGS